MKKMIRTHGLAILLIFLVSLVLILPQLITKGMVIGSDAVFHYNRFYDAAMQIKEGNFQPFISMYGFQQSGRIVNALYGPLVAYIQGFLVLLSPSWFGYQVLSRLMIFTLSGISMYALLNKAHIRGSLSCAGTIFYLTTFSIQYWTMRQGFSSWGAAILPLCLLPIVDMAEKKDFNWLELGILTALMFQTHVFTSLILILIYLPFFLYALIQTSKKIALIKKLAYSIGIFLLLTLAIWISFYMIYSSNTIADPFINQHMDRSAITRNGRYWLTTPIFLAVLLVGQVLASVLLWKKYSPFMRLCIGTMCFFLILSTNLVPWEKLQGRDILVVDLIQFPFRFFVPVTIFLILLACYTFQRYCQKSLLSIAILTTILAVSVGQVMLKAQDPMHEWNAEKRMIQTGKKHLFVRTEDKTELKNAVHSSDFTTFLKLVEKSTPDYLPIYQQNHKNNYRQYEQHILALNPNFKKYVKNHQLYVEWTGEKIAKVKVPIVKYARTELSLNGKKLTDKDILLTKIGTITVKQQPGKNVLTVTFKGSKQIIYPIIFSMFSWIIAIYFLFKTKMSERSS